MAVHPKNHTIKEPSPKTSGVVVNKTLVIDNFAGRLTRYVNGDLNSGFAKYATSYGYDPFSKPGNLTFLEDAVSITPSDVPATSSVVAMAMKSRLENVSSSMVTYVYSVYNDKRISKIQVNNPGTQNPNYDNSSTLTTLSTASTLSYGSSLQFYTGSSVIGTSDKLFVGHDQGVTKVNTDGSSETAVSNISSIKTQAPRPSAKFLGKIYFGNGNNIMEVDSTETVSSYAKLNPGFPTNMYVRDLDVTPDGNYLIIIVSPLNSPQLDSTTQDTTALSSALSYKFLWNGSDVTFTSYESYHGYTMTANRTFGPLSYMFGYDLGGGALYSKNQKIISLPNGTSPNFDATFSTGNLVGWAAPEAINQSVLGTSLMVYGKYDEEQPAGLYRLLRQTSSGDIVSVPTCETVSNLFYGATAANYTDNKVGVSKLYFSLIGTRSDSTPFSRLYRLSLTAPINNHSSVVGGVYETQTQLFSKKVNISQVRIYGEPWVANNAFTVDLMGSNNSSIIGASYTFSTSILGTGQAATSSTLGLGQDYAWYSPSKTPTYALGLKITNQGSANVVIHKVEIDVAPAGI